MIMRQRGIGVTMKRSIESFCVVALEYLVKQGKVDAVVCMSKSGNIFLRSRPDKSVNPPFLVPAISRQYIMENGRLLWTAKK